MDADDLVRLQARATASSGLPVTLVDPRLVDQPLIWVNDAFTTMTGYTADEVVGRNCRFLQGPDTDRGSVAALRSAIEAGRGVTVTLLNHRRDGSPFWNRLRIDPITDEVGQVVAYVGVQTDVSAQIMAEQRRDAAVEAERSARRDTDRARIETDLARRRLTVVSEITSRVATSLDLGDILDTLAVSVVPLMADWVAVALVDDLDARMVEVAVRSARGGSAALDDLGRRLADDLTALSGTSRILNGEPPFIISGFDRWRGGVRSPEVVESIAELGLTSAMYVPLVVRDRVIGTMAFVAATADRSFSDTDLEMAAELGRRVGLIVDNARLYRREHLAAETLQRSLLPTLPTVKDLAIGARYLPADRNAAVGGDLYEVLALPDGSVVAAVGDVVGHDLSAAASMGQLRSLLRSVAWTSAEEGRVDPAEVLQRVDRLLQPLEIGPLATMVCTVLRPPGPGGGPWSLAHASAGHPAPLVRLPDGEVLVLDDAPGLLLGTGETDQRTSSTLSLPPGSILLAFTDGLVERRYEDLAEGYGRVVDRLTRHRGGLDHLLDDLAGLAEEDRSDDMAVLALAVGEDAPAAGGSSIGLRR